MYNLEPCSNVWKGMTLDQINEVKDQMQKKMPLIELLKNKASPDSFIGFERNQKLRFMGFSDERIEEMTGFKRKPQTLSDPDSLVELVVLGKDLPEKWREVNARLEAEWKCEYERVVKRGIALGYIEEESDLCQCYR
jgi:hypothetical protein